MKRLMHLKGWLIFCLFETDLIFCSARFGPSEEQINLQNMVVNCWADLKFLPTRLQRGSELRVSVCGLKLQEG